MVDVEQWSMVNSEWSMVDWKACAINTEPSSHGDAALTLVKAHCTPRTRGEHAPGLSIFTAAHFRASIGDLTVKKFALICAAALAFAPLAFAHNHEKPTQNVVEIAAGNPDFSTLVTAIKAAGLAETLSGTGPFTVFAPTNDAFAKLPAGTVENLLKPENKDQLVKILTYHVVAAKVTAADVVKLDNATTVQGGVADVTVSGDKVMIDNANVVKTDIMGTNGVIHVIDAVIMPK